MLKECCNGSFKINRRWVHFFSRICVQMCPLWRCSKESLKTFKICSLSSLSWPCFQGFLFNENTVSSRVSSWFYFAPPADSDFHSSSFKAKLTSQFTINITLVYLKSCQSKWSIWLDCRNLMGKAPWVYRIFSHDVLDLLLYRHRWSGFICVPNEFQSRIRVI